MTPPDALPFVGAWVKVTLESGTICAGFLQGIGVPFDAAQGVAKPHAETSLLLRCGWKDAPKQILCKNEAQASECQREARRKCGVRGVRVASEGYGSHIAVLFTLRTMGLDMVPLTSVKEMARQDHSGEGDGR